MPRSPLLPLPDSQAAAVLRAVSEIESALPADGSSSHVAFVDRFIAAVYAATGRIYGASIYRRLLKQFAPHRGPGTVTLQRAVERFKAEHQLAPALMVDSPVATEDVRQPRARPPAATSFPNSARMASPQRDEEWQRLTELMEFQRQELAQARAREHAAQLRAKAADDARERALVEAAAVRAELQSAHDLARSRQETIDKLTAALEVANQRAAGDNRMAMLRVDGVRQEIREVEEKLRAATAALARKDKELRETNTMLDNFRIKSSRLQQLIDQQQKS